MPSGASYQRLAGIFFARPSLLQRKISRENSPSSQNGWNDLLSSFRFLNIFRYNPGIFRDFPIMPRLANRGFCGVFGGPALVLACGSVNHTGGGILGIMRDGSRARIMSRVCRKNFRSRSGSRLKKIIAIASGFCYFIFNKMLRESYINLLKLFRHMKKLVFYLCFRKLTMVRRSASPFAEIVL